MTPWEMTKWCVTLLNEKKAHSIKAIHIEDISSLADYFVFANGTSTTQVKALADQIEMKGIEMGVKPHHVEGYQSNSWILLDYGTVVIHIFTEQARSFYDLDRLWQDGEIVSLDFLQHTDVD